jgi:hypothetical protein
MRRPGRLDAEMRSLRVRLLLPLSLVLAVIGAGTVGYRWLWRDVGGTWLDTLFMTVTTITTIGYGEVKPLTGAGRRPRGERPASPSSSVPAPIAPSAHTRSVVTASRT